MYTVYVIVMLVDMWALRNLSDGAVHVFLSYLVFFVELTFPVNNSQSGCMIDSPLCNKHHYLAYFNFLLHWTCVGYCIYEIMQFGAKKIAYLLCKQQCSNDLSR